jgi:hypothetical protein
VCAGGEREREREVVKREKIEFKIKLLKKKQLIEKRKGLAASSCF